jgi:hypothetical protein
MKKFVIVLVLCLTTSFVFAQTKTNIEKAIKDYLNGKMP